MTTPTAPGPPSLGPTVELTLRLMRRHGAVLIALYAVIDLPLYLLGTISADAFLAELTRATGPGGSLEPASISQEELARLVPALLQLLGMTILLGIVSSLSAGAVAVAVREALDGRRPRFGAALGTALRRSFPLLGSALLALGATVVLVAAGIGLLVLLGLIVGAPAVAPGGGLPTFLGLVVVVGMLVAIVALQVRWTFQFAAVALDGEGSIGALRRSWRFTRGSAWRVFGISLVFVFATFVLASLVGELGAAVAAGAAPPGSAARAGIALASGALGTSVIGVLIPVSLSVLYLDLRARYAELSRRPD